MPLREQAIQFSDDSLICSGVSAIYVLFVAVPNLELRLDQIFSTCLRNKIMFAVISDIHSNLEALEVVLDDIEKRGIRTIYCLGDVVGYGPNPIECLDLVIDKTQWCVMGNHDFAALYEPTNFNYGAEQASFWTRDILEAQEPSDGNNKRWRLLGELPLRRTLKLPMGSFTATLDFVHASPRRPINEYIFPDDVYTSPTKISTLFERVEHICFIGHTHMPGVFLVEPDFYLPDELNGVYPIIEKEKAIINIGSVGQPRDRDTRAGYVCVDEDKVHFIRLEYDFKTTLKKIQAIDQLDDFHGERLSEGR